MPEDEARLALERLDPLWEELFPKERARIIHLLVDRVDIGANGAEMGQRLDGLAALVRDLRAWPASSIARAGAAQMLTVRVPLAIRKRGGRKLIVMPGGTINRGVSGADNTMVKALARAFRWRRMPETGRYATLNELTAAEEINSSYVSRLLRLRLLAPDIVEAILDQMQPEGMTLPGLMEPFSVEWAGQGAANLT